MEEINHRRSPRDQEEASRQSLVAGRREACHHEQDHRDRLPERSGADEDQHTFGVLSMTGRDLIAVVLLIAAAPFVGIGLGLLAASLMGLR
jgi:hypothetical protein